MRAALRLRRYVLLGALLATSAQCSDVDVTTVDAASVQVAPAESDVQVGQSAQLTARVLSSSGDLLTGRSVAWASEHPDIATVDGAGTVLGVATGAATIRASSEGASGTATVNVTPLPEIRAAETDVHFSALPGGAAPAAQTISITNGGGGSLTGLAATVSHTEGQVAGWLQADIGPNAPTALTLSATNEGLETGVYTATVRLTAAGAANSPVDIAVTLSIGERLPAIATAPSSLTFRMTRNAANPASQNVAVTNSGGGALSGLTISVVYPGGQPGGWITTSLGATTAPSQLTVGVTGGSLATGEYTAEIRVASPVATNSPRAISVALQVDEPAPLLSLSAETASFSTTTNASSAPPPVAISVVNAGGGTLSGLSTAVSYAAGQPGGWLSAALDRTTAPAVLTLSAARGSLGIGEYAATVNVSSTAGGSLPVAVTFTISDSPPAAPSGLQAIAVNERRIDLSWTDASTNESSFVVERITSGNDWAEIGRTDAGVTAWVDSADVAAGTAYLYRVRACNAAGCSAPAASAGATSAPAAPSALRATLTPPVSIQLAWTDNSPDETAFRIERSTDGSSWSALHSTSSNTTSYMDDSGAPQTTYHYRVRACRSTICSTPSAAINATTGVALPSAPANLEVATVSSTAIDLSWSASNGTVDSYRIEQRTGTGAFAEVASVSGGATTHRRTGLSPATTYTFRVRACNASGCSPYGGEESGTTHPATPGVPGTPTASVVSSTRIDLSWGAASGNVGEYRIERRTGMGGPFEQIAVVSAGTLAFQNTGLSPGTPYGYRIRACNVSGCSAYTGPVSATTNPGAPGPPGSTTATTISSSRIDVSWSAASGVVEEYAIMRATAQAGPFAEAGSTGPSVLTFQSTELTAATTYYFEVRACNVTGCTPGAVVNATTHPLPPSAPGTLNASAASSSQITLTWSAATGTVSQYHIERRIGTGAFAEIATTAGTATSFPNSGLEPGTTYGYRVRACNAGGCSGYSPIASATTLPALPAAPAPPNATTVSTSAIDIAWAAPAGVVDEFRIERSSGGGGFTEILVVPGSTLSTRDQGLSPETTYSYRLRACNASGCSPNSGEGSATTHPVAPGAPGTLSATTISATRIDLAWSGASGTVAEYRVERGPAAGGPFTVLQTVSSGTLAYQDLSAAVNQTYFYQVLACNITGCTASPVASASTIPPDVPTGLTATPTGPTQIDLSWTAVAGEVSTYQIERTGGDGPQLFVVPAGTFYRDDTVVADVEFTYRIQACNAAGCSAFSEGVNAATTAM